MAFRHHGRGVISDNSPTSHLDPTMSVSSASSTTLKDDFSQSERSRSSLAMAAPRARSPEDLARIRVKNRRKRYLDLHPDYFSASLELAGLHI